MERHRRRRRPRRAKAEEPRPDGARTDRLRRRRRSAVERRQALVVYALAAVVAFAAVVGAWYVASQLLNDGEEVKGPGHLTLLTLTAPDTGEAVAAALVVRDAQAPRYALYVIPPDLLLSGPNDEYVFAADSMATGTLQEDLERVVGTPIDAAYVLPASALGDLAPADELRVELERPVTLEIDGVERTSEDEMVVEAGDLAELFAATRSGGYDGTTVQEGVWAAVLRAATLRPAAAQPQVVATIAAAASGTADRWYLDDALKGLSAGEVTVARMPSTSRVAEGQFAFVPDKEGIMAEITRKGPGYNPQFTVIVRNGSGKVGVGTAVVQRLSVLDVNLPSPLNADDFDHRQTRIFAGSGALPLAEDIRAILGRGVVLNGADLPSDTVLVIVGDDLKTRDLKPKDQP